MARRGRGRPAGGGLLVDRDILLDAAERVIARDGNGASLDDIAAEAGVTKPVVYARIGSRAELSNALAERLADRIISRASQEIASRHFDHAALVAFFRATLETIGDNRELFLYVSRGSADDTAERALYLARRSAEPLTEFLVRWRRRHGQDASVADPWAYAIVGMLNVVSLWWVDQPGRPGSEVAEQLADLVWPGLGVTAAP
jgi:AcrR family transcriptional regulator